MVEMWGGGGSGAVGGEDFGGGGGAYSRSVIAVTPGTIYEIVVGGGGTHSDSSGLTCLGCGKDSSMSVSGGQKLIFAGGGEVGGFNYFPGETFGFGGKIDTSAAISRTGGSGGVGTAGGAYGTSFCPNGPQTGNGGNVLQDGNPGYVLLVW